MLAPKFLLSGFGVLSVAATFAAIKSDIFSTKNQDKKDNSQNVEVKKYKYLIVSASKIVSNTETQSSNDFAADNYKCEISESVSKKIYDDSCEIYKLNSNTALNNQYIELNDIAENSFTKVTTLPVNSNYYVLKIEEKALSSLKSNEKVVVVNKTELTQKYIELKKEHVLEIKNNKFETNLILAQITSTPVSLDSITDNSYKCKFTSTQENSETCKIYSLTSNNTPTDISQIGKSINSSHLEKLLTSSAQKSQNSFVIIQTNSNKNERELRSFSPAVYKPAADNSQSETKLFETKYINSFAGSISETPKSTDKLFTIKPSSQDYLVVVAAQSNDKPSNEIQTAGVQNYKCKTTITTEVIDDTCELIEITNSETNKSIDLEKVKASKTSVTSKNSITTNKYFKLIVNNSKFINHNFTDTNSIIIEPKQADGSKNYGTLKVVSKFSYEKNEGKTVWFLAKGTTALSDSATLSNFKCKYLSTGTAETCDIFKTSSTLNDANYKNFNLTGFTKVSVNKNDLTTDKYLIVKLTNQQDINIPKNQTIQIIVTNASANTNLTALNVIAPLHGIAGTSNENNLVEKPIFLN